MNIRAPHLFIAALSVAIAAPAFAQDAKALRALANAEQNQEKQVILLCKAADLEPKNKDFRKDCDISKSALITSDKQQLKTALDAADAGQIPKAKRYAKYVSALDPDTHRQAEQLLARLSAGDAPPAPVAPVRPTDNSAALLATAMTSFDAGNLSAAKTAAQGVTDPLIKSAAVRVLTDIDHYNNYVSAGRSHEESKDYAGAERSYQSALEVNSHVGGDDLNGKIQRMRQMAAAAAAPAAPAAAPAQAPVLVAKNNVPTPPPPPKVDPKLNKPPDISPEEKKRKFLDEANLALSRKDNEGAVRGFHKVLDIDPNNAEAKNQIAAINTQIAAELSRDPAKLEKTLREAITAFYSAHYEDAESSLNRYLGADIGKKKGAAFFYLGATESTLAFLDSAGKRGKRQKDAQEDFKQARAAGYQPVEKYVSSRILEVWKNPGM